MNRGNSTKRYHLRCHRGWWVLLEAGSLPNFWTALVYSPSIREIVARYTVVNLQRQS